MPAHHREPCPPRRLGLEYNGAVCLSPGYPTCQGALQRQPCACRDAGRLPTPQSSLWERFEVRSAAEARPSMVSRQGYPRNVLDTVHLCNQACFMLPFIPYWMNVSDLRVVNYPISSTLQQPEEVKKRGFVPIARTSSHNGVNGWGWG